ncbi:MAG: hypothetical protein ACRDVO_14120 [Jiangellaceae bacterium]
MPSARKDFVDWGDYTSIRATLSESVQRLAGAGADFLVCPDNTAHMALEQPGEDLALPGLHIAEVVADQAARDRRTGASSSGWRRGAATPSPWCAQRSRSW